MPPTTVEPKAALDTDQRAWLKKMGAALQVKVGDAAAQGQAAAQPAGDAAVAATIQKIKDVVLPRIQDAVAADPSKKEEIVELLKSASTEEKQQSFESALKKFKALAATVQTAVSGAGDKLAYEQALPGAELKLSTMKDSFARSGVTSAEVTKMEGHLKTAKEKAAKDKYNDAYKELKNIEKEYAKAKPKADDLYEARSQEDRLKVRFYNLQQHQGFSALKDDPVKKRKCKEIGDKIKTFDAMLSAGKASEFWTASNGLLGEIETLKEFANRHGDYLGLRNNALLMVKSLEAHPKKDAITASITDIKTNYIDKAKTEYEANADPADAINRYTKARDLLNQVEGKYKAALTTADNGAKPKYETDRDAAKVKLTALDTAEKRPFVANEIAEIKAKLDLAEKRAGVKQYSESIKLIAEIVKQCDGAEKLAKQQLEQKKTEKAAGDAMKNIEKKPKEAVAAVEKLYTGLKGHAQAASIKTELETIKGKIENAKKLVA